MHNDNLLVGFDTSDDASVFRVDDNLGLVQSIDFFPPMVDDPYLFGQIAAANSLSDIYAMGGRPSHAMNLLCIPSCTGVEVAGMILAGGADKCVEAGCSIAGGHTINDDEPKYGLSVSGFVSLDRMLANSGARVGDVLLLTKAIGSGIITTAIKGELIEQDEAAAMFDSMSTLNEAPIRLAEGLELHGCTDVTGFGLIGHACEMAEGSGAQVELASGRCRSLTSTRHGASGHYPRGLLPQRGLLWPARGCRRGHGAGHVGCAVRSADLGRLAHRGACCRCG